MGIYGVDLICHVEREMPSTLTYLVPRPFEAESASKTGTRATGRTPPHPPAMLPGLLPTEQAASSLLQMLRQISLKRWRVTSLKKKYLQLMPSQVVRKVKGVIRSNCQVHFASEDAMI